MSCHEIEPLLDEFVDGELDPERRRRVERHIAGCSECHRIVNELRVLGDAASKLPRGIAPGHDLFPGIRERIARHDAEATAEQAKRRGIPWAGLAASLLVILIGGSVALWLRGGGDSAPSTSASGEVLPARGGDAEPFDAAVREYEAAAELLLAAIEQRRDTFSPETLAVLERNLAIIDRAIEQVRVTLEADPKSRGNALVLAAMHEQKVELLRRVSRLSS
jgi:anti-sigma factor RsiW